MSTEITEEQVHQYLLGKAKALADLTSSYVNLTIAVNDHRGGVAPSVCCSAYVNEMPHQIGKTTDEAIAALRRYLGEESESARLMKRAGMMIARAQELEARPK